MAFSAHAHRKWPKWFKTRSYWQKFRSSTNPDREKLWTKDILPKSTTMAVSAHAQWQIRQEQPKRKHAAFDLRQVHIQKRIVMYNFYTRHTHTHHDVKLTSKKARMRPLGGRPIRPPPLATPLDGQSRRPRALAGQQSVSGRL